MGKYRIDSICIQDRIRLLYYRIYGTNLQNIGICMKFQLSIPGIILLFSGFVFHWYFSAIYDNSMCGIFSKWNLPLKYHLMFQVLPKQPRIWPNVVSSIKHFLLLSIALIYLLIFQILLASLIIEHTLIRWLL